MKLINTFALIAGAIVITTEAVKLSSNKGLVKDDEAEEYFKLVDKDKDGMLSKDEFKAHLN